MGIIILATIFFPEYSVPSIMPTTRNCLTSCRGHACIREQKVRIISWKDSSIWRPSSHWLQMRQMPEHLTRQFLQMTFAGNSPLYVCVCVFLRPCAWARISLRGKPPLCVTDLSPIYNATPLSKPHRMEGNHTGLGSYALKYHASASTTLKYAYSSLICGRISGQPLVQPVDEPRFRHLRFPLQGTDHILHRDRPLRSRKWRPPRSFHATWNQSNHAYHKLKQFCNDVFWIYK